MQEQCILNFNWRITMRLLLLLTLTLSGCADLSQMNRDFNISVAQATGTFVAPTLGGSPRPSGCSDDKCRQLDRLEEALYGEANRHQITFTLLVNRFYEGRARLFPESRDSSGLWELRSFQLALAEHVDLGKVSAAQWAYLVDAKANEISERNRGRRTVCNTTNTGTREFPEYRTVCRQ